MERRKYTKTRRAEQQSQTRAKIVEALIALHEEIGPAKTTIKAVAERAGVERLTVYRYFPDVASQLQACSSLYFERNPLPDDGEWQSQPDTSRRICLALTSYYRYYRQTAPIYRHSYRDADEMPEVAEILSQFEQQLGSVQKRLMRGLPVKGARRKVVGRTLLHGLQFSTWESLEAMDMKDEEKARLVSSWLQPTG